MRAWFLSGLISVSALATPLKCDTAPAELVRNRAQKLFTEHMREVWGPIQIRVVQENKPRKIHFVDEKGVVRAAAETVYRYKRGDLPSVLQAAQKRIDAGEPIGPTFRSLGFGIEKHGFRSKSAPLPLDLVSVFETEHGKFNQYEFVVITPDGKTYRYAGITEWEPVFGTKK